MIFSGARRFGLLLAGARWRWLIAALVASLVSVGVSAWGAESAQAGLYKDVQLTVVNKAARSVTQLSLCSGLTWAGPHCPFDHIELGPSQAVSHTAEDVSGFMASSIYSAGRSIGYFCSFSAHNPGIGRPYFLLEERGPDGTFIRLRSEPQSPDSGVDFRMDEGEKRGPIYCGGFDVVLYRKDDTSDAKVMQINIMKVPNEPANAKVYDGSFRSVSAGYQHTCGVRPDDTVVCWGYDGRGQTTTTPGLRLKSVSAGGEHTCGVRPDDTVVCWGKDDYGQARPPGGTFRSVSAGDQHTCGVRPDDTVACWGKDSDGQARPPGGTFKSVSAGGYHTCAVRTDDTVVCWGYDHRGQARPPGGAFKSVSAGGVFTCGVRPDDTVVCWGKDDYGQARPPGGTFRSVSAGFTHTCGVRPDDTVVCWGKDDYGQARPPGGTFRSVSAGFDHTCGLRTNDTVACWGDNSFGQS